MSVRNPPNFSVASVTGNHIHLRATDTSNAEAHVWVLEHDVIRVAVLPAGGAFTQPRTWAVAPGLAPYLRDAIAVWAQANLTAE